jgi:alpha-galactosidase
MSLSLFAIALLLMAGAGGRSRAAQDAQDDAQGWIDTTLGAVGKRDAAAPRPPFSFVYGGQPSETLLRSWRFGRTGRKLDASRLQETLSWTDPRTGLVVTCVAVAYRDFPAVEWTVAFTNTSAADTPILESVRAIDAGFGQADSAAVLHHFTGAPATPSDYAPHETPISRRDEAGPPHDDSPVPPRDGLSVPPPNPLAFAAGGGRPSNSVLPYFNVAWRSGGAIVAVGWPGQWSARFSEAGGKPYVQAGQERTNLLLHPGESIRTPLIALLFYRGDWIDGQNLWRRWMLAHNVPRVGGKPQRPVMTPCSSHQYNEMQQATEESQMLFIRRYQEEKLPIDYWWMDTGWFPFHGNWVNTGTWEVDRKRFPNGLRAITDYAHARGVKCILWFEPERVTPNSWLYDNHPEWLLKPPPNTSGLLYDESWRLLNLGDPDARAWITDRISEIVTSEGIDLYRQDFNVDPLPFWRSHDAPDRQGITENRYVEGYLAFWDELRRRHPSVPIDSCASGGRRDDLETLRRAVPHIRSDHLFEPVSQQGHFYGCAFWYPLQGTGTLVGPSKIDGFHSERVDPYVFLSDMSPDMTPCWDMRDPNLNYAALRRLTGYWKRVNRFYSGDYYPLTPYSLDSGVWMAWQFHRPDLGAGMVQAFRRSEAAAGSMRLKLRGLYPERRYRVTELQSGDVVERTGRQLAEEGLEIEIPARPGAALYVYSEIPAGAAK